MDDYSGQHCSTSCQHFRSNCLFFERLDLFRGNFSDPIFVYYRVLSIVNILSSSHNILEGMFFSPRYLPHVNTYLSSIAQIYIACMTIFLFHFSFVLQMGILITRMKLFNPFVKRNFTTSPKLICVLFSLTCLLINSPTPFSLTITSLGNYFFYDSYGHRQEATFYYISPSSEFASSLSGKLILGITIFFMNLLLSLIIDVVFSIISFVQYKAYLKRRRIELKALEVSSIHNRATTSLELKQQEKKAADQQQIEKNIYMSFLLCTINILSRLLILISAISYFFFSSFADALLIQLISFCIYFFVPFASVFVFYFFNRTFRNELKKMFKLL